MKCPWTQSLTETVPLSCPSHLQHLVPKYGPVINHANRARITSKSSSWERAVLAKPQLRCASAETCSWTAQRPPLGTIELRLPRLDPLTVVSIEFALSWITSGCLGPSSTLPNFHSILAKFRQVLLTLSFSLSVGPRRPPFSCHGCVTSIWALLLLVYPWVWIVKCFILDEDDDFQ